MKKYLVPVLAFAAGLLAGCANLEVTPEGNPDRIVDGTVNVRAPHTIPAGATVVVRLVDNALIGGTAMVLGEQSVTAAAGGDGVPFRLEFRAEDAVLRRGVDLQARVTVDGRLRFVNAGSTKFTLSRLGEPQELWLVPAQ